MNESALMTVGCPTTFESTAPVMLQLGRIMHVGVQCVAVTVLHVNPFLQLSSSIKMVTCEILLFSVVLLSLL